MANILEYLLPSFFGGGASAVASGVSSYSNSQGSENLMNQLSSGKISAEQAMAEIAKNGYRLSPEQESYLSSMLSNQRTNEARSYETEMANTDLLRAAEQLGALGLSPSNVYQTGGSATPNVAAASTPMLNNANQRYDRYSQLANSLIGMAGRMASAGIYGGALKQVRDTAAKTAALATHSARTIRHYNKFGELTGETEDVRVRSNNLKDLFG